MAVSPEAALAKKLVPLIQGALKDEIGKGLPKAVGPLVSQVKKTLDQYDKGGEVKAVTTGGKGSDYLTFNVVGGESNTASFKVYGSGNVEISAPGISTTYTLKKVLAQE